MGWYYKDGDQEIGPVDKQDLQNLIKAKKINARTLVRSTEMTEWRALAEMVRPKAQGSAAGASRSNPSAAPASRPESSAGPPPLPSRQPPPLPGMEPPPAQDTTGPEALIADTHPPNTAVCSQCGRSLPEDQVVRYDDQVICAACKPMFVQRLKEGVAVSGSFRYAGFWIRFVAKFLDGILMGIAQWIILIPLGFLSAGSISNGQMPSTGFYVLMGFQQLLSLLIPAAYNTFFVGRFGSTPGKMACRLKVVMSDGAKVSYMRALGRNFAEWVSAIILAIGYIMAAFDSEKRALHDRICDTRVVYKS